MKVILEWAKRTWPTTQMEIKDDRLYIHAAACGFGGIVVVPGEEDFLPFIEANLKAIRATNPRLKEELRNYFYYKKRRKSVGYVGYQW